MLDKPRMFFSDSSECFGFLNGLNFAITSLDVVVFADYNEVYETVAREHGWKWKANSFYRQLKEDGEDDTKIIEKLLLIEIEVFDRLYRNLPKH